MVNFHICSTSAWSRLYLAFTCILLNLCCSQIIYGRWFWVWIRYHDYQAHVWNSHHSHGQELWILFVGFPSLQIYMMVLRDRPAWLYEGCTCTNQHGNWLIDWQFYFSSVTHLVQLLFSVAEPYTHHSCIIHTYSVVVFTYVHIYN